MDLLLYAYTTTTLCTICTGSHDCKSDKGIYVSHTQSFSYFSLPASQSYIFNKTFEVENASLSVCTDWTQEPMPTGDREALKFFIIEELTGEVVSA